MPTDDDSKQEADSITDREVICSIVAWIKASSSHDGRNCYQPHVMLSVMAGVSPAVAVELLKRYE